MANRTLLVEITPNVQVALDAARRDGSLASDEAAAAALLEQAATALFADERERERKMKILDEMRTMYPDLHGLTYGRKEKEEMFEGMEN